MAGNEEIKRIFFKLEIDNRISDYPLSALTSYFKKLDRLSSYNMDKFDFRQVSRIIRDLCAYIAIHLMDVKKSISQTYNEIIYRNSEFVEWYQSLSVPYRKYVCAFLTVGDYDYLRGFMSEDDIKKRFGKLRYCHACFLCFLYLDRASLDQIWEEHQ